MTQTFRSSKFIDFDSGRVVLAPMDLLRCAKKPWSFDQKLEIFACRVEVWQFGIAVEILKEIESSEPPSIWSHAAYGLVSVAFSYFEMIGKSLNPESRSSGTASVDFNWGFCDVYPIYKPVDGTYNDSGLPLVREFRDRVRNGMYHLAFTKSNLWIHNDDSESTEDFCVREIPDGSDSKRYMKCYFMNAHRTARTIVDHFPGFISRVTGDRAIRNKFEQVFEEFYE